MLTLERFASLVGEQFLIESDTARPCPAVLIEAKAFGDPVVDGRTPFTLMFEGPLDPILPQSIYRMSHPVLQVSEVFIVPVARCPTGIRYEAVYN